MGRLYLYFTSLGSLFSRSFSRQTSFGQPDGTLKLAPDVRRQMQTVLDEASDALSELDKVSLERLFEMNPQLLGEIKKAAEEILGKEGGDRSGPKGGTAGSAPAPPPPPTTPLGLMGLTDSLGPEVAARFAEWKKLDLDYLEKGHDIVSSLQHSVRIGTSRDNPAEDPEAMGDVMSAASAAASYLTLMLQGLRDEPSLQTIGRIGLVRGGMSATPSASAIDPSLFTNEGLRKKGSLKAVVEQLYEGGLPFYSSSDGRRFAAQKELSDHLDEMFRRRWVKMKEYLLTLSQFTTRRLNAIVTVVF